VLRENMSRIAHHLRPNERILWEGKPVKKAFILPTSIVPVIFGLFFLMPFLLFFLPTLLMGFFYGAFLFTLLWLLMPLALILGPTILALMAYRNTEYIISDQRIITQTGAIGIDTRFVDHEKIQEVYVRVSFWDKIFRTGSIMAITAGQVYLGAPQGFGWGGQYGIRPSIAALREPYEVQRLLQEAIREAKQNRSQI